MSSSRTAAVNKPGGLRLVDENARRPTPSMRNACGHADARPIVDGVPDCGQIQLHSPPVASKNGLDTDHYAVAPGKDVRIFVAGNGC